MGKVCSKRWVFPSQEPELLQSLARELRLRSSTVSALINRGIRTKEAARIFLNASASDLLDPMRLNGMDQAVSRIRKAIRQSERIVVYGDYDVDGVTATSLYLHYFKNQGIEAGFYIPHRLKEGYGLNESAIRSIHAQGAGLLITADCGTTSVEEIRLARSLGMDVIVTDHHEVPDELPPATALLNPKRADSGYPEKGLCTAGLTFKVIQALNGSIESEGLDLVALGTIADVSPLMGENRFLVKEGLKQLSEGKRPGIRALKEAVALKEPVVKTGTVGFTLAPRINAAGRLNEAHEGLRLLMTESSEEARRIAQSLNHQNQQRQQIERKILEEAFRRVDSEIDLDREGGIVLASRDWHLGVVGIVAARLVERYYRPTILLAVDSNGIAKGSARSIAGFHLHKGLQRCSDLLVRFGGHQAAAGLTLREEQVQALRQRFSSVVFERLSREDLAPRQMIDAEVAWEDLNMDLVHELEGMAPFGPANPEPTLLLRQAIPIAPRIVGMNHLKFSVSKRGSVGRAPIDVIGFRMGDRMADLNNGTGMDLVFTPERNSWQGRERLQLRLRDLRPSQDPPGET